MFFAQMTDQFTDLYDLFRVQSDRRLIEYDNLRIPQDRLCKPDTLPVSFGQIADHAPCHFCRTGRFHCLFHIPSAQTFFQLF